MHREIAPMPTTVGDAIAALRKADDLRTTTVYASARPAPAAAPLQVILAASGPATVVDTMRVEIRATDPDPKGGPRWA
jgi:hypothetical protein